ncbi:hypothetical protein C7999DRAFT_27818 [Corynascus novoguineensis]|uniref:Uncharacterized protein n=1 Tax=Corynascus novoguineensis TaxID=1126955 RepID=A0AAN7D146_9PEZI|nr:hypothetical protein C7999DRAFT_27818 [Corynascus novoguineensis]
MPASAIGRRTGPDPDVDSSTEEGAEIMRQAAYGNIPASLYDKARDHQDQLSEAERQRFLSRGDAIGKALAYPDSLTTDEIHEACGWPPPDVVRASIQRATSGRLSTPFELYAKAKDALDHGQFDTIISDDEALLIAHGFYARDEYFPSKSMAAHGIPGFGHALTLLSRRLGLDITVFKASGSRWFEVMRRDMEVGLPGSGPSPQPSATTAAAPQDQASQEQSARERLDALASTQEQYRLGTLSEQDFSARVDSILAAMEANNPSRPTRFTPPPVPFFLLPPGVQLPSPSNRFGSGPWPTCTTRKSVGGFELFYQDTGCSGLDSANRAAADWAVLPEDQKEAYRARAEARRREAWAEYETRLARKDAGLPDLPPPQPARAPSPSFLARFGLVYPDPNPNRVLLLSGFEVFRDELVAGDGDGGLGFGEVLARWEALTDAQRMSYERRSW